MRQPWNAPPPPLTPTLPCEPGFALLQAYIGVFTILIIAQKIVSKVLMTKVAFDANPVKQVDMAQSTNLRQVASKRSVWAIKSEQAEEVQPFTVDRAD